MGILELLILTQISTSFWIFCFLQHNSTDAVPGYVCIYLQKHMREKKKDEMLLVRDKALISDLLSILIEIWLHSMCFNHEELYLPINMHNSF